MVLLVPDGLVAFRLARDIRLYDEAWFPTGKRHLITQVTLFAPSTFRFTGERRDSGFSPRNKTRAQFTVDANAAVPVLICPYPDEEPDDDDLT